MAVWYATSALTCRATGAKVAAMLNRLSTSVVAPTSLVLVLGAATLGACVDPGKRFDDFHDRVPIVDASTVDRPPLDIANIDGGFYLAIKAINFNNTLHLYATWDVDANAATLSATFKALSAPPGVDPPPRMAVGTDLTGNSVTVDETASFVMPITGTIDGMANPISGSPLGSKVTLVGTIKDANLVCGTVTGKVCLGGAVLPNGNCDPNNPETPVEPATFAAVRVAIDALPAWPDGVTDHCPSP